MPFTTSEARRMTDALGPKERGDYTFIHYRNQLRAWRRSTRWTTADELAERLFPDSDKRAEFLAYLVFFNLHVMPYEVQKRTLNGEIDY